MLTSGMISFLFVFPNQIDIGSDTNENLHYNVLRLIETMEELFIT